MAPPKLTEEDIKRSVKLYEGGLSLTKIGRLFGVSGAAIRYRLLQAGLTVRTQIEPTGECEWCGGPAESRFCKRQCWNKFVYERDKESIKARARKYAADNKEIVSQKKAEYRKKKRKDLAAAQLARYYANKEAILANNRERRKREDPEVRAAYHEKSRCKKRRQKMEMELSLLSGILL